LTQGLRLEQVEPVPGAGCLVRLVVEVVEGIGLTPQIYWSRSGVRPLR
jgi:hypothetical protein